MSRDILREYIEDYNAGRIDAAQLQIRLDFDAWKTDSQWQNKAGRALNLNDYEKAARDPLDIVIERENAKTRAEKICRIRDELSTVDWQVFLMYVRGATQAAIARATGMSQPTVSRRESEIKKIASRVGLREILELPQSTREARTPKVKMEYPVDFFKKHAEIENGKKVTRCRVPEYLSACGCENTVCCYCDKCSRRDKKPEE